MREFCRALVLSTFGSVSGSNFSVLLSSRHQEGSSVSEKVLPRVSSAHSFIRGSFPVLLCSRDEMCRKV